MSIDKSTAIVTADWTPAACKLNLCLHINQQRTDGYHELQSLFQLIAFGDRLRVEPLNASDGSIEVSWISGRVNTDAQPKAADDLLFKAARILQAQAPNPLPAVRIVLEKNAPIGGGLGGGSAAAATALHLLNHVWSLDCTTDGLAELGLALGADVPFFVHGHTAMVHGVGEVITPCTLPERWFVLAVPTLAISTASLFADPTLNRHSPKVQDQTLINNWQTAGWNDFEPVVLQRHPELAQIAAVMDQICGFARLTGTGGCLFAPANSEEQAQQWAKQLETHSSKLQACHAVRGLNRFAPLPQ